MKYFNSSLSFIFLFSIFFFDSDYAQTEQSWKIFDDSHVARVDITIDTVALNWIYNHVESDSEHVAGFRFRNNWIDESVDSIGFRIRGNTSRDAKKKSFKISFNTFNKGRDFYSLEKLNLNGEHNDPSIIRSKLCFDLYKTINVRASRANHIGLYINGKYYGLYINVEHIDEEFLKKNFADDSGNLWKCLYPADLVYHGSDPNVYRTLGGDGRPVYELSTNELQLDFTKFAKLIDILNNTPYNIILDSIESVLDVPEVLKYFAMNVLTGSWDDYWSLMNNYYLYHEPSEDLFHLIPYDYDNSFGVDWFNINWTTANPYNFPKVAAGPRPLAEKILANSQYRNLYTHFIEFIRDKVYSLNLWEGHIDSLKNIITPQVLSDPYRALDYGFTTNDFFNSYSSGSYSNQHIKNGLKQFINLRSSSIQSQLSYITTAKPIVYRINYEPKNPKPEDSIRVFISAFSKSGISTVEIHFTADGSTSAEIYPIVFSPVENTKIVDEADRYVGTIPPLGNKFSGKFSIFIKDLQNQSITFPRKGPIKLKTVSPLSQDIVINEFLSDNINSSTDPDGEHDDWLEIYNPTSAPVLLTGKYLTDNPTNLTKWKFTASSFYLNPGEYLVLWCDEDLNQLGLHTNFKLSKSGEYIAIVDSDGVSIIDSITFGSQKTDTSYGRFPDASPNWLFMNPSPGRSNI
ncbi:MAG: CotH kinase family protein, partial [Ignavibacteriaceae bacterium]|nr:CotH kinase family protein [Ignavibacteriaceae bacterium]